MTRSLRELEFLLGRWSGIAEGPGTDNGSLTSTAAFTYEPGKSIISGYRENREGKKLENRIIMIFLYDKNLDKFVRKDIYSYGFAVNQIGEPNGSRFTFDSVGIDSEPEYYKGVKFRTFVEQLSEKNITMGVETAKPGETYRLYVQQKLKRA
jgi:hypothetical protein